MDGEKTRTKESRDDAKEKVFLPGTDPAAVCCFTGHRRLPEEFRGKIEEKTSHVVDVLISAGYRWFLAGGALGYDMLAERVVAEKRREHPEIRLILALPCRDQTGAWLRLPEEERSRNLREYQRLKDALAQAYADWEKAEEALSESEE